MRFAMINDTLVLSLSLDDLENLLKGRIRMIDAPDDTLCLVGVLGINDDPRVTDPLLYGKVQSLIKLSFSDMEVLSEKMYCELNIDLLGPLVVVYEPAFDAYAAFKGMRQVDVGTPVSTSIN